MISISNTAIKERNEWIPASCAVVTDDVNFSSKRLLCKSLLHLQTLKE
ncbi:MAG: hypothetical protein K0T53_03865 [Wolbachia pipientis]|nr:hypothetical protein [Wolbachia pipientis]